MNRPEVALNYIINSDYVYMSISPLGDETLPGTHRMLKLVDSPTFDFVFAWKRKKQQNTQTKALLDYLKVYFNLPTASV